MNGFWDLNLIHFLDFYFMVLFLAGTMRRWGQYQNIGNLAVSGPSLSVWSESTARYS